MGGWGLFKEAICVQLLPPVTRLLLVDIHYDDYGNNDDNEGDVMREVAHFHALCRLHKYTPSRFHAFAKVDYRRPP